MPPKTATKDFGPFKAITTQLAPMKSLELFPEVMRILAPALAGNTKPPDEIIRGIADALIGRLAPLAPDLLSTTIIIENGPTKAKYELAEGAAKIDEAFSSYSEKSLSVIRFAVEVSFAGFLAEVAQFVKPTPTP